MVVSGHHVRASRSFTPITCTNCVNSTFHTMTSADLAVATTTHVANLCNVVIFKI